LKFVLPRFVLGNRGDIASRWGVINALHLLGIEGVSVFCDAPENTPPVPYPKYSYGKLRNLIPTREGWQVIKGANIVLWVGGLDFQDDSSLLKLFYLWIIFRIYRVLGLRIWCFLQGAGPLDTRIGRMLGKGVLKVVDRVVVRDTASKKLLHEIYPQRQCTSAHDGIFLPNIENSLIESQKHNSEGYFSLFSANNRLVVGFNIRIWFHFDHSILPYQVNQKEYKERSRECMRVLIDSSIEAIKQLRQVYNARVVLISGYQPDVVPWEDDLIWLKKIKERMPDDPEVILVDSPMTMQEYFTFMSLFDLVIAMRLHTSLVAFRLGVPSINLNYTLKGRDILNDMQLDDYILDVDELLDSPEILLEKVDYIVNNLDLCREKVRHSVSEAIETNFSMMKDFFKDSKI